MLATRAAHSPRVDDERLKERALTNRALERLGIRAPEIVRRRDGAVLADDPVYGLLIVDVID